VNPDTQELMWREMMRRLILMLAGILYLAQLVSADVIVKYEAKAEITNRMLLKIENTNYIKGNKIYSELKTNISATNGFGTPFDINSKGITRLDKGVHWSLLKSGYSEETIASMHDSVGQAKEYNWTFNVSPVSDNKKIKKFTCFGQIGKAIGVGANDLTDTVFLTYERWATADTLGIPELTAYENSFANLSGVHKMWSQEHVATYLEKGYGAQFEKLSDLLDKQKGIPIKSSFEIERTILYDNTSAIPGSGKRPKNGGNWKVFSMTNEIVKIEQKKIDDDKFEIPANYKKKQP
jgi:hypothetical protein